MDQHSNPATPKARVRVYTFRENDVAYYVWERRVYRIYPDMSWLATWENFKWEQVPFVGF